MNFLKRFLTLILAILFAFSFSACQDKGDAFEFSCFNTHVHVQSNSKTIQKSHQTQIQQLFYALEKEFDPNEQNSIVYKLNDASAGETIPLNDHALTILTAAKQSYEFTDGDFNPTVYPLVKLWGFAPYKYTAAFSPPQQNQIVAELEKVGFDKIILNAQDKTLSKTDARVKIDLGGIVKGYAADCAKDLLREKGYFDGYINVGGSSLTLLSVNELSIRHPKNKTEAIISVNCKGEKDLSVSTSGDYEKYYVKDGQTYCHIISPKTGYPTQTNVNSISIIGIDGAISDALTTAGCLKEHNVNDLENSQLVKYLRKIIAKYPQAQVFAVYTFENNKILLTNKKQGEHFTLLDNSYTVVNI